VILLLFSYNLSFFSEWSILWAFPSIWSNVSFCWFWSLDL